VADEEGIDKEQSSPGVKEIERELPGRLTLLQAQNERLAPPEGLEAHVLEDLALNPRALLNLEGRKGDQAQGGQERGLPEDLGEGLPEEVPEPPVVLALQGGAVAQDPVPVGHHLSQEVRQVHARLFPLRAGGEGPQPVVEAKDMLPA